MSKIKGWLKCEVCQYEWRSRIGEPKACPRCKRYDWKIKEKGKINNLTVEVKKC